MKLKATDLLLINLRTHAQILSYVKWRFFAPAFVKHAQKCVKSHLPKEQPAMESYFAAEAKRRKINIKAKISKVLDKESSKGKIGGGGKGLRKEVFAAASGGGGGGKEGANASAKEKVEEKNGGSKRRRKNGEEMVPEVRGVGSEVGGSAGKRTKRACCTGPNFRFGY